MSFSKLVSIIVPIYNVDRYLEKFMTSIIRQTYSNMEVLCMIDGSPDSSLEICQKFAERDSRIKVLYHDNCGCAKTRNKALEIAKGDFVCFIDPDDYVSENYIESLLSAIEQTGADFASANMVRVKGTNLKKRTDYSGIKIFTDRSDIVASQYAPPCYAITNKMFRMSFLRKHSIRFQENVSWCDDIRFSVDTMTLCKSVVSVGDATYFYVKRGNSISHSIPTRKRQQERFIAQSEAVRRFLALGITIPKKEVIITRNVIYWGVIPVLRKRVNIVKNREYLYLFGLIPIGFKNV